MNMFLAVLKWNSIDAATKQLYFPSEMFCGSPDRIFELQYLAHNDVTCIYPEYIHDTSTINISRNIKRDTVTKR